MFFGGLMAKFKLFSRKKNKGTEKNHREPIIVRIYKASGEQSQGNCVETNLDSTTVDCAADSTDTPSDNNGTVSRRFTPNKKYFSVSVYTLITALCAMLLAVIIFNIATVINLLSDFLSVMAPFIGAGILAFIVSPLVNFFDEMLFEKLFHIKRSGIRKTLSVILVYIILLGLLALAIIILIPQVIGSLKELLAKSKELNLTDAVSGIKSFIAGLFPDADLAFIDDWFANLVPSLTEKLTQLLGESIPFVVSTSYAIISGIISFLLAIAISIYMVCDKRRIARAATALSYSILPVKKAAPFINTARECGQIFFGFIIGKSIDSLIIGVITFIVLTIGGLPYPVLVSVIVGVTNMIPFFGPFIGAIPGILLYLCLDPVYAFAFAIIILAIQQFDGWVLGPLILGDSTGISPIWVIFGITIGGAYFGVPGMFLGVPVTAVVVYLARKLVARRLKKKNVEVS